MFFDFGMSNGLRNKLSGSLSVSDYDLSKEYVSVSYYYIGILCILLAAISFFVGAFINWNEIFSNVTNESINVIFPVLVALFFANLALQLISSVCYADGKSYISSFIQMASQLMLIVLIIMAIYISDGSIKIYAILSVGSTCITLLVVNVYYFSSEI